MATYRNDPRVITAKFSSKCAETAKPIKKGEACLYYPLTKQVYYLESEQYRKFHAESFDMAQEDLICQQYGY